MSRSQLPEDILPYRLADQGIEICGVISTHRFIRLRADQVDLTEVWVEAKFGVDEEGRRTVVGRVKATADLICQRCLQPMKWSIDVNYCLQLVAAENQLQSVPSHLEPWLVVPGVRLDMADMIEDTLYLELPMFPMHIADDCSVKIQQSSSNSVLGLDRGNIKPNPFEQLASLTKRPSK